MAHGDLSKGMSRGLPKRSTMQLKSHHMRRWHLSNPWCQPLLVLNYAAVMIQKIVRGRRSRKRKGTAKFQSKKNARIVAGNSQLDKYLSRLDYYKITKKSRPSWMDDGYSSWCAVKIQSVLRMRLHNQRYLRSRMMMYQIAVLTIQSGWKIFQFRRQRKLQYANSLDNKSSSSAIDELAALVIQVCWRSFCSRRIFEYFRDLICVKLKGAPADLLKCIVPNESSFLDFASGTHVRFRLGGHTFPPSVYFKIYTHRPLCDVNSFAPRDYSKEMKPEKMKLNSAITNTGNTKNAKTGKAIDLKMGLRVGAKYFGAVVTTTVGVDQWYKREEGNPWRCIASSVMSELVTPPWSRDSISNPIKKKVDPFHFSRLRRRADVEAEKRRKKREWMVKAYQLAKGVHGGRDVYEGRGECQEGNVAHSSLDRPRRTGDDSGNRRVSGLSHADDKAQHSRSGHLGDSMRRTDDVSAARSFGYCDSGGDRSHEEKRRGHDNKYRHHGGTHVHQNEVENGDCRSNEYHYYNNSDRDGGGGHLSQGKDDPLRDDSEMLQWSIALDFEEYSNEWRGLATSLPSDMALRSVPSTSCNSNYATSSCK